jgi:SAM-dependent methyltransferase
VRPSETGAHYDALALFWQRNTPADYGVRQLERAISFTKARGPTLDVGCGSHGRFLAVLGREGFQAEGLDISLRMIELARGRSPGTVFHTADICEWEAPKAYDFISAWDSTFHLPIELQEPVTQKLCDALAPGGVLLFTCGGGEPGEITGSFEGQDFGYSTLGVEGFVRVLHDRGCFCRHVEYDQHPKNHVFIIAQKT